MYSGLFNVYCDERGIYELWNVEYMQELALYLMNRIQELTRGSDDEVIIMDVGAGDGALMYHLEQYIQMELEHSDQEYHFKQKAQKNSAFNSTKKKKHAATTTKRKTNIQMPKMIATDNGSWNIQQLFGKVEMLDVVSSIAKYTTSDCTAHDSKQTNKKKHMIVLCSWMPMGEDWTHLFRQSQQQLQDNQSKDTTCIIQEYILIGESDDGSCGHNWLTWGNPNFLDDDDDDMETQATATLYEKDGYQRIDLEKLSSLQFSRYDSSVSSCSKTVSFQRK
uniref:Methyltransferase domain-containing protein n=1 Tax=Ditylum brightwellii TaxID=49249 RepID=A0A7S1ZTS6_9STRA|mmetsp:Transcript_38733/g.58167  ORF Transcript_38733/g.58167 Transcript_38733/m.58167 type:complete len:278 (+) Transcript_38733:976-1809(+)